MKLPVCPTCDEAGRKMCKEFWLTGECDRAESIRETTPLSQHVENLKTTLQWCEDFKEGNFTPAPTEDGWSVEMHGLVTELLVDLPRVLDALEKTTQAVRDSAEVAQWLSALLRNPDGANSDEAWNTWENTMRPKLHEAMIAISDEEEV